MLETIKRIGMRLKEWFRRIRITIRDNRKAKRIVKSNYRLLDWAGVLITARCANIRFAFYTLYGHKAAAEASERLFCAAYVNGNRLLSDYYARIHPDYKERRKDLDELWSSYMRIREGKAV